MRLIVLAACAAFVSCAAPPREAAINSSPASPYLLIFAGDQDEAEQRFPRGHRPAFRQRRCRQGDRHDANRHEILDAAPHGICVAAGGRVAVHECASSRAEPARRCLKPPRVRVAKTFFAAGAAALPARLLADAQGDAPGRLLAQRGAEPRSWRDHFTRQLRRHRGVHRRWGAAAHGDGRNAGSKPSGPTPSRLLPDIDRLVVTSAPMMESTSADVRADLPVFGLHAPQDDRPSAGPAC